MHDKLDEYNTLKSKIVIEFKESYNRLLNEIKKYKFRENSMNGFAVKQNRNSMLVIADLQLLNGILDDMLQNIDSFLVANTSNEKVLSDKKSIDKVILMFPNKTAYDKYEEEKKIVINSLKFCIEHMNNAYNKLIEAMYTYYDDNKKTDAKNSVIRARKWKKQRNNALHIILNVASSLSTANRVVNYAIDDDKSNESGYLDGFMDYLSSRPNYYSYLSPHTKSKVTGIKKLSKSQKKRKVKTKSKQSN